MAGTLLLADDSVTIQKVVKISFANEDLEVVAVDNGDDAIETARSLRPDVILADVVMPGRNGYEVCAAVRDDPDIQHIPILLLAGTFEDFDPEEAKRVGASGHLNKPFEAQTLVDRVHALLDVGPREAGEPRASARLRDPLDDFDFGGDDLDLPMVPEESTIPVSSGEKDLPPLEDEADILVLESELFEDEEDGPELFAELLALEGADSESPPSPEAERFDAEMALGAEMAEADVFDPPPEAEPLALGERPATDASFEEPDALPPVSAQREESSPPETGEADAAQISDGKVERLVERVLPSLREELHQSLERIAWEAFGDLSRQIVVQAVERVEQIAWETVPKLAEALIQEEIRKLDREE